MIRAACGAAGDESELFEAAQNGELARVQRLLDARVDVNSTPATDGKRVVTIMGSDLLCCYDMDGKLLWKTAERKYRQRLGGGGAFTASAVAADGRLYFASEDGEVMVVRAGPEFEKISQNDMNEVCMATPAISDGMIFIRTQHSVFGIGRSGNRTVERSSQR